MALMLVPKEDYSYGRILAVLCLLFSTQPRSSSFNPDLVTSDFSNIFCFVFNQGSLDCLQPRTLTQHDFSPRIQ